jgi:hypothetical protein
VRDQTKGVGEPAGAHLSTIEVRRHVLGDGRGMGGKKKEKVVDLFSVVTPVPMRTVKRRRGPVPGSPSGSALGGGRATWLILPVVICLSQRLSHACVSINSFVL